MNLFPNTGNIDADVIVMYFIGGTPTGIDNKRNALALQLAASIDDAGATYQIVLAAILRRRKNHLRRVTELQRHWQTRVSHRPVTAERTGHHDSWSIREKYVRCAA